MKGQRAGLRAIATVAVLAAACVGCSLTDKRDIYEVGCRALRTETSAPPNAVAAPIEKCTFYIGKSGASLEMPYSVSSGGQAKNGVWVIWLKRIGTRWEFDRVQPVNPAQPGPAGSL